MAYQDPELDMDVVRDILRYFLRNPQAMDNLEGLARWRLLDERIHRGLQRVSRAMAWLVSRGLLLQEEAGTSSAVFCLNAARRAEVEKFLEAREAEKTGPHQK